MRRLLSAERQRKILERVAAEGAIDFQSLADELNVSSMTVRRDVRILEELGHIGMTRGGAAVQIANNQDILTHPRAMDQSLAKSQIGQYAASLIEPSEVLFLGSGSTTAVFAQFLPNNLDLTVITPSLPMATLLFSRGIKVISTGGNISTHDMAQTGPISLQTINRFVASRAVIGAGGVSKKEGLTEFDQEIADLNRAMAANSELTMCLIDPSKAGVAGNFKTLGFNEIDEIVTASIGREIVEREISGKVKVLTPPI